jgi:multicomponent Na+:H+ antiporter subunit D
MVGIPPTVGFISKWYLAWGTIKAGNWLFLVVILASSLLNAVYFFRIIEKVYMKSPDPDKQTESDKVKADEVSPTMLLPTLVLAVGLLVFGVLNTLMVKGIIFKILSAVGMAV